MRDWKLITGSLCIALIVTVPLAMWAFDNYWLMY